MKKVLWIRLAVQVIYLASIVPYMGIIGPLRKVFDSMNIKLSAFSAFIVDPPGLYLHPAVVTCAFALFLWSWRTGRLENQLLAALCNLPVLTILAAISVICAPVTSDWGKMGRIHIPPASLSASAPLPLSETACHFDCQDNAGFKTIPTT
jgi:hypothetical protein